MRAVKVEEESEKRGDANARKDEQSSLPAVSSDICEP